MSKDYRSPGTSVFGGIFILMMAFLYGCSGISARGITQPDSKTGITNPMSVNDINNGGRLAIQKSDDERPLLIPGKSIGNLHMHTTCSDGKNSYEEMVQKALSLKFSFIAITDHTYGDTPLCKEVIRQCREEKRLLCISGMEVTGKAHLLAIGIQRNINKHRTVKQQVEEIHRQKGIAIAAHPFRLNSPYTESEMFETGLDAIECKDIPLEKQEAFFDRIREQEIPCVSSSDAHNTAMLEERWMRCDGEIRSFADLKAAMKGKRCGW